MSPKATLNRDIAVWGVEGPERNKARTLIDDGTAVSCVCGRRLMGFEVIRANRG